MTKTVTREELKRIYDFIGPWSEGLARVRKGDKYFHIRPDGKPAYKERYDAVGSFFKGRAHVKREGKQFYIRPDGVRV